MTPATDLARSLARLRQASRRLAVPDGGFAQNEILLGCLGLAPFIVVFSCGPWVREVHALQVPAAEPTAVEGLVRQADADSGAVPGAEIVLAQVGGERVYHRFSDQAGRFRIVVEHAGPYRLTVARLGYETRVMEDLYLEDGQLTRLTVEMEPEPVSLESLRVTATPSAPAEFWERKNRLADRGHFLTPEYIEATYPRLGLILREVPGVWVDVENGRDADISFASPAGIGRCQPALYLNGHPLPSHPPLREWVDASDIVGVEVYRSNSFAPEGYRSTDGCGVVLVWAAPPSRPERGGRVAPLLLLGLPFLIGALLF